MKSPLARTALLTTLLTWIPGTAVAQSDVFDQFFRYNEASHAVSYPGVPEESIDPFSGTVHILQTDVVLPGKAGFDLRLVRSYSSRIWGRTDDGSLASLIAETDRSPLGYGWSFHMGRLKNPNATGQPTGPCSDDYPVLEMPDGSARVFYRAPALGTKVYLSRDLWRMEADCSFLGGGGKGSCVWSTDGVRYEFSSALNNSFFTNAATLVWPASTQVDQFNNTITIIYNQDRTGNINTIIDTYGRTITFDYQGTVGVGDGTRLSRIIVGANTYTYGHTAFSTIAGGTRRFLTSVQPPVGPSYVYTYAITAAVQSNRYALQSMTYPNGAVVGYVYSSADFNAYVGPTVKFAVLQSKSLLDRGGAALGTWTYAYTSPANGGGSNVTTILRPDGRYDIFNIFGFGATSPGTFWKVGLLDQDGRGCSSTSLSSCLETETRTWDQRAASPVSPSKYSAPGYAVCASSTPPVDNAVYAPALATRTRKRDGATYTTTLSNWDAYAQPQTISESGQQSRTTTLTYFYAATNSLGTLNLVRDRLLAAHVCIAGSCYDRSWAFTPGVGTGFPKRSETTSGVTTSYGYDTSGNLTTVTDAAGKVLTIGEYVQGNGTPRTFNFGGTFSFSRTTSLEGWIMSQTDGRGNQTVYGRDAIGRLTSVDPPGPNETVVYTYDNTNGATIVETRGAAYTKTTTVDGMGRERASSDSLGIQTSTKYDLLGRVWFRSAPYDSTTAETGLKTDYDALGREVTFTKGCRGASGPGSSCNSTVESSTVIHSYNTGNCIATTEQRKPDSVTTTRCYTSFGEPDERRLTGLVDANGKSWSYSYTAFGNLSAVTAPISKGNRSYGYDAHQYLATETVPEMGTIPGDTVSVRYTRNNIGQPLTRKDARGNTWIFTYDSSLSRATGVTYASGSADNFVRTYQSGGSNVASVSSSNGGTVALTSYDELNRLRRQEWTLGTHTYVTTLDYDGAGCLRTIGYPTGTIVTQTCDAANRVKTISIGAASIVSSVTYHPSGQPKSITFGNGRSTSLTFDDRARPKTIASSGAIDLAYGYDGMDSVISFSNATVSSSTRTMTYDALNRLATASAPSAWGNASYQYDELGNRTYKSDVLGAGTFIYDTNNRLASSDTLAMSGSLTLTWDIPGRLATSSDGATYSYDGLNRRIKKTDTSGSVLYHHDPRGSLLAETLADGTKLRDFIYLGDRLIAVDGCVSTSPPGCSQRQWYHTDVVGTPLARSDLSGIVARMDFLPWGEPWASGTSGASGDRRFNGRVSDPGTGFSDYGARVYFPAIGRFLTPDGAPADPSNPTSFNRYSYVLNGPHSYTDPDGHLPFLVVTAGLGAAAGALWGAYTSYTEDGKVNWQRVGHYAIIGTVAGFTLGGATAAGLTGAAIAETAVVGKAAVLAGYGGYVWAAGVATEIAYAELTGLSPQQGTVVLGQYTTRVVTATGETKGMIDSERLLAAEALKLGGKLLNNLPKDINAIKPEIDAAKRIVFFVGQKMSGLTGEEFKYIMSKPELIKKTIFVREAPWTMPLGD